MKNLQRKYLDIMTKLYDGELIYADKPFVNPDCDKLSGKLEKIRNKKIDVTVAETCEIFDEFINLLEIECFAKGAKFMLKFLNELEAVNFDKREVVEVKYVK